MTDEKRIELIVQLTGQLFATQLAQVQVWKHDDVDIMRLQRFCFECATDICISAEDHVAGKYGDDESKDYEVDFLE